MLKFVYILYEEESKNEEKIFELFRSNHDAHCYTSLIMIESSYYFFRNFKIIITTNINRKIIDIVIIIPTLISFYLRFEFKFSFPTYFEHTARSIFPPLHNTLHKTPQIIKIIIVAIKCIFHPIKRAAIINPRIIAMLLCFFLTLFLSLLSCTLPMVSATCVSLTK